MHELNSSYHLNIKDTLVIVTGMKNLYEKKSNNSLKHGDMTYSGDPVPPAMPIVTDNEIPVH